MLPDFSGFLALIGGFSGLAVLAYMVGMVYYARKRSADVESLRREVAEVKGILLGRRR